MSDDIKTIVAEALKAANATPSPPVKEGDPGVSGVLENIPSMKIMGLQVGDAVKGLIAAGAGDVAVAILKSKMPPSTAGQINVSAAIAKGGIAWLFQTKQVKGFLGSTAANIGSALLVMDAITEVVQVRTSVFNMIKKFTGTLVPGSGLVFGGQNHPPTVSAVTTGSHNLPTSTVIQAGRVVEDYYAHLGGG